MRVLGCIGSFRKYTPTAMIWTHTSSAQAEDSFCSPSGSLSVVDARTTEETALVEGYARKSDLSFGAGGGVFGGGAFGGAAGGGYQDTEIGQVIVLAYLDAYTKLVGQLGGLPENAAKAAPQAK